MITNTSGLSLRLLDRRSSIPLASAVVNLVWHDGQLTTVHADIYGVVDIDLPQGAYDLMIGASGYLSSLFRGIGVLEGQRIELIRALVPGTGHELAEEPSGAIGGIVLDRLDQPLMNVVVQVTSSEHSYTARTDKHGGFVLHNVIPTEYEIVLRSGDRALLKDCVTLAGARQFQRFDARLLYI